VNGAERTHAAAAEGRLRTQSIFPFVCDDMSDRECGCAVTASNNPQFQRQAGCQRVYTVGLAVELRVSRGGIRIAPMALSATCRPKAASCLSLRRKRVVSWQEGGAHLHR